MAARILHLDLGLPCIGEPPYYLAQWREQENGRRRRRIRSGRRGADLTEEI